MQSTPWHVLTCCANGQIDFRFVTHALLVVHLPACSCMAKASFLSYSTQISRQTARRGAARRGIQALQLPITARCADYLHAMLRINDYVTACRHATRAWACTSAPKTQPIVCHYDKREPTAKKFGASEWTVPEKTSVDQFQARSAITDRFVHG